MCELLFRHVRAVIHAGSNFLYSSGFAKGSLVNDRPLLVIVTLLSGEGSTGVETHFSLITTAARERGVEVEVVTPYTSPRLLRAPFRWLKNLRSERSRVAYRRAQGLLLRWQLGRIIRRKKNPEITLYAQCPLSAVMIAAASRTYHRIRKVAVIHYNQSEAEEAVGAGRAQLGGVLTRHLFTVESRGLPQMDTVVFVSEYMRKAIHTRLPTMQLRGEETIMNFPSGELTPPLGKIQGDLIAIGSLEPRKNQEFLLRMLRETQRQGQNYKLTLVGEGPDKERLVELAAELGVDKQVIFTGYQAQAARLIYNHRILVHSALLENCPLIVAEALSCGRPVAAAPVGGIPEMYRDGIEGIFWDLHDAETAARKLIHVLQTPGTYQEMSHAAYLRYQSVFASTPHAWMKLLVPAVVTNLDPSGRAQPVELAAIRR